MVSLILVVPGSTALASNCHAPPEVGLHVDIEVFFTMSALAKAVELAHGRFHFVRLGAHTLFIPSNLPL